MAVIFIVGFSGAGKSTVGQRVADRLGYCFADTDDEIEKIEGRTVVELFADKGESEFRRIEREVLENLVTAKNMIVATGGGLSSWGDNMEWLNTHGLTLYMKLLPEELLGRLHKGLWKRPLLANKSGEELQAFVAQKLKERESYYLRAQVVMDCSGVDDDYITSHIEQILNYIP